MQLWKKNFLFVFTFFQSLLYTGLLLFVAVSFQNDYQQEVKTFQFLIKQSREIGETLLVADDQGLTNSLVQLINQQQQFYFQLEDQTAIHYTSLPLGLPNLDASSRGEISLQKTDKKKYLAYQEEVELAGQNRKLSLAKDSTAIYQAHRQRTTVSYLIGLLGSALFALILYWQMKKIYKPITNLSHELRTPLTLISGYGELLMRLKTTEAEKIELSEAIVNESLHLQEVIEHLLIMGDLKEGSIKLKPIKISTIFQQLQAKYPLFKLEILLEDSLQVNQVLLIRLLDNLLKNAFQASDQVEVRVNGREVLIINQGPIISPRQLRKMNHSKKLAPDEYSGSGQGFIMCREIMNLHRGTLKITSSERGTKVKMKF